MRLNCYPCPEYGLWISESNLASALKEGEADLALYGDFPLDNYKGDMREEFKKYLAFKDAFRRLIRHNGVRIRQAGVRELKWLGLSLLWCWMPLRRWLEVRIDMPLELTFRRLYEGAGFHNYFWKCRPIRGGQ